MVVPLFEVSDPAYNSLFVECKYFNHLSLNNETILNKTINEKIFIHLNGKQTLLQVSYFIGLYM